MSISQKVSLTHKKSLRGRFVRIKGTATKSARCPRLSEYL